MDTKILRSKLALVRSRLRMLMFGHSSLMFCVVAGGLAVGSFLLDWLFQLPFEARALMLIIMLAVMVRGASRFFFRTVGVRMSDEDVALLVESRKPEYGDELITALQLERQAADDRNTESRELMYSVVEKAVTRFRGETFHDVIRTKALARPALMALAAIVIVGSYATVKPEHARLWYERCILLSDEAWPPRTRLVVRIANIDNFRHEANADGSEDVWVPEGSVVRVEIEAGGDVPSTVMIKKYAYPRSANPVPITIEVPGRPGSSSFEYKFGRVNSSFEFHVHGGDDRDEKPNFRIMVRSAPRIDELSVDYDYPRYINDVGIEDRMGVREYNVVGPVGSEVTMRFKTSTPLQRFELILDENEAEPIILEPEGDATTYVRSFTLDGDHFYTYRLIGANGAPSRRIPNFNISAQQDLPPQLGIVMPETGSVDVTTRAVVPLKLLVSDDYGVGEIEVRWDTSRDGAFANRIVPDGDDLRRENDGREVTAFHMLELGGLTAVEEGATRPLRPGDNVFVRFIARDTRDIEGMAGPNESVYPSFLVLHLRENAEIERELMRGQVRLKDQVTRVRDALDERIGEITALFAAFGEGSRSEHEDDLHGLVAGQALITSSLSEAGRGFLRVFDGYLFNRMDPSPLTETMIASLTGLHRASDERHYELVARTLPEVRGQLDDAEPMGKLTRIMDMVVTATEKRSPAVSSTIRDAVDAASTEDAAKHLETALSREKALREDILALLDKMEEWEDFQDVIQSLKDMIDLEKGLLDRMKKVAK